VRERAVRRRPTGPRHYPRLTRAIDIALAGASLPLAVALALDGDWVSATVCAAVCPLALAHYQWRFRRGH
jgi:hypothetical protein